MQHEPVILLAVQHPAAHTCQGHQDQICQTWNLQMEGCWCYHVSNAKCEKCPVQVNHWGCCEYQCRHHIDHPRVDRTQKDEEIRVRVIRNTHPQRSEPFQGTMILIIIVEATRAIIVILIVGIEWAVGILSCNTVMPLGLSCYHAPSCTYILSPYVPPDCSYRTMTFLFDLCII